MLHEKLKSKLKLRLAAWHVGVLVALAFFTLNARRMQFENLGDEDSGQSFLKNTDRMFFDSRILRRDTRPMSGKVGILAIDDKSIAMFGRWPFPRDSYAKAFDNLKAAGVKWIGLDVLFSEPERPLLEDSIPALINLLKQNSTPAGMLDPTKFAASAYDLLKVSRGDVILGETFRRFGNVVQAVQFFEPIEDEEIERDLDGERKILAQSLVPIVETTAAASGAFDQQLVTPPFFLANTSDIAGTRPIVGFINNTPSSDGLTRTVELVRPVNFKTENRDLAAPAYLPSLSLQLAAKYLNRKIRMKNDKGQIRLALVAANGEALNIPLPPFSNHIYLNHYGTHQDARKRLTPIQISLADATENILPKELPDILILGTTTDGISDVRPSPLNPTANGVEHHVTVVENILREDFLVRNPKNVIFELFASLIAAITLVALLSKLDALLCAILLIFSVATFEIIDHKFFFSQGKIIHLGFFHLQNFTIFSSMILYRFFVEEREKRKVKGAFQQYLNPSVINELLSSPDALKLGGEKRELTVFFSDVRGFTSISERLSPEVLANLLNEYFTPMTDIVLESGGLLDKYIGDALMAVWGAPLHTPNHADRALHSSLRMLDALDKLRESWKEKNLPAMDIGCGINTGPMVVGNMGSTQRFNYTVLGDTVNLGSRLEGITKEYGVRIICSDSTRRQLKRPEDFILRELDSIKVKGKNEPIIIYEVMRVLPERKDLVLKTKDLFEQGLSKYRMRDFEGAMQMMLQILQFTAQDGPASVFLERCEYYLEHPPAEDWDGVWVMKTK